MCLCCVPKTDLCVARKCSECAQKSVLYSDFDPAANVPFHKWKTIKEPIVSKNKANQTCENTDNLNEKCQPKTKNKTVKQEECMIAVDFVTLLDTNWNDYMGHQSRITHQYKVLKELKMSLSQNDLVLHIDFSENYLCKYAEEIQGVRFGSSRDSLVLHTGVAYTSDICESFCTVLASDRKDPAAIIAHICPILDKYLAKYPVTRLHILSDGPTTQYRCKSYFHLLTKLIPKLYPQILMITHNFSEAGHGKGAPDGVGGCVKNVADDACAHGTDVNNLEAFIGVMNQHLKNIFFVEVKKECICEVEKSIPTTLEAFVGTIQVHQLTWAKQNRDVVCFNTLSCFSCPPGSICTHFSIGKPWASVPKEKQTNKRKR